MIKGVGVDLIEISRVRRVMVSNPRFAEKIFTGKEIDYCRSKHKKEVHYAARFAAKEAFFKALGTGWRYGMKWQEIAIDNDSLGKPQIAISGKVSEYFIRQKLTRIHLSISHTRSHAVALVVIE